MTGLAAAILVIAVVGILWLLASDALRQLELAHTLRDEHETRRHAQIRALARELVLLDPDFLVTPRNVEIPFAELTGDFGLEDALETLDSIEALG